MEKWDLKTFPCYKCIMSGECPDAWELHAFHCNGITLDEAFQKLVDKIKDIMLK